MKVFSRLAPCCLLLLPAAFGGVIDFETGAPPVFAATTALTNAYAGLGVAFSGPGARDGGAILDQLGGFGVSAHSGTNFLAFNLIAATNDGGVPRGPENIFFSAPVFNVALWVGGSGGSTYTLQAFDASSNSLGSATVTPMAGHWSQLSINTAAISRLLLSFDGNVAVVDDLTWNGNSSGGVPEPSTLALFGTGIALLAGAARRRHL